MLQISWILVISYYTFLDVVQVGCTIFAHRQLTNLKCYQLIISNSFICRWELSMRWQYIRALCFSTCYQYYPLPNSRAMSKWAFSCIQLRTEHHLHRTAFDSSTYHPLSHLVQSRTCGDLAPVLPTCILTSAPHDFSRSTCSWPHHIVKVHSVGLFWPDVNFTTENECFLSIIQLSGWIIWVNVAPVFYWRAVVEERIVCFEWIPVIKIEPLSFSTVEVLVCVSRVYESVRDSWRTQKL